MKLIKITIFIVSILYVSIMVYEFVVWDRCYYFSRITSSPEINYWLVGIGVMCQIAHVLAVIICGCFKQEVLFKLGLNNSLIAVMFLIATFSFTGAVRHGVLQGDKSKAYFHHDEC